MLKSILKKIYDKFPRRCRERIWRYYKYFCRGWFWRNPFVFLISLFIANQPLQDLNIFEQSFCSQNGEDGLLNIIFKKIGTINKFCVEFGVEDGFECNTAYLINRKKWNFLQMDNGEDLPATIKREAVTAENINELFGKYGVPSEFDLLSIDIDGNDYWVWKALQGYSPRVVVIEYNSSRPLGESSTVKYDTASSWDGTDYFGASLAALYKLGREKGYTLIACDNFGINAFFVRNDLVKNNFIPREPAELFRAPQFGKKVNGAYVGHPASGREMIPV